MCCGLVTLSIVNRIHFFRKYNNSYFKKGVKDKEDKEKKKKESLF